VFYRERHLARQLAEAGARSMVWLRLAFICLIGAVAGCDDSNISGIERRSFFNAKALSEVGSLMVEIHGAPWPGATPDELASTLRMPDGVGKAVRFSAVRPGQWIVGSGERLVLHFNPSGAPDHIADCRTKKEFQTKPPTKQGFTVSATYCKGPDWQIHTFLNAEDVGVEDWLGYIMNMRKLLGTLFPEM
jgi:hypothetical protein